MAKKLLFAALTLSTMLFSGCALDETSSDMIWDITPINFVVYVQDDGGNNLLDPDCEDNLLSDDIKVVYDGKDYPMDEIFRDDLTATKAYKPVMSGLKVVKINDEYVMIFGELDGSKDWDTSFVIDWGDGSKDEISFVYDFDWGKGDAPSSNSSVYLNDKKVEGKLVIIR